MVPKKLFLLFSHYRKVYKMLSIFSTHVCKIRISNILVAVSFNHCFSQFIIKTFNSTFIMSAFSYVLVSIYKWTKFFDWSNLRRYFNHLLEGIHWLFSVKKNLKIFYWHIFSQFPITEIKRQILFVITRKSCYFRTYQANTVHGNLKLSLPTIYWAYC